MDRDNIRKLVLVKSLLISYSDDQILKLFSDLDSYKTFLASFSVLLESDPTFLLLSNFSDKAKTLINYNRFELQTKDNIRQRENDIIQLLNQLKLVHESKENCLKIYQGVDQLKRKYTFFDTESFFQAIAYDNVVLQMLDKDEFDFELGFVEKSYCLSSINYFGATFPELFQDKVYADKTIKFLDNVKKGTILFQVPVHHTKKLIYSINKQ